MVTKKCSNCGIDKELTEFYKNSRYKYGVVGNCKVCFGEKSKKYCKNNREKRNSIQKNWRGQNKEKVKNYRKKYYDQNPEKFKLISKTYLKNNPEKIKQSNKKYYWENLEYHKKRGVLWNEKNQEYRKYYRKKWRLENKEHIRIYKKTKYSEDIYDKLKNNLRGRINSFLKARKITKKNKTIEIVGCSPEFLKEYLEKKFVDGMSWDNRSQWHIDHIIPLSSAKNEEEIYKLCHYTNLQPLWAIDNLKKTDKII